MSARRLDGKMTSSRVKVAILACSLVALGLLVVLTVLWAQLSFELHLHEMIGAPASEVADYLGEAGARFVDVQSLKTYMHGGASSRPIEKEALVYSCGFHRYAVFYVAQDDRIEGVYIGRRGGAR